MKRNTSMVGILLQALVFVAPFLTASAGMDKATVTTSTQTSPWSGSLATGWDSLYMFRGVNQLPGFAGYGSSLSWTSLTLTWSPTANDSFSMASWTAFGLGETDYKETDSSFTYTRAIGNLSLSAGYALYAVLSSPGGLYSNELNVSAAYQLSLGPVTLTPSLTYDFTLGPAPGNGGYVSVGVGYLEFRVDGEVALYRDLLKAAPWVATGFNFGYNTTDTSGQSQTFSGANQIETGLALPLALNAHLSLAPYVTYSHSWVQLTGTRRDTFWGGVSATFSF